MQGEAARKARAEEQYRLGLDLENMGKIDDAIIAYIRALTVLPELGEAHLRLADIYSKRGNPRKAEHHSALAKRGRSASPPAPIASPAPPASRPAFVPLPRRASRPRELPDKLPSVLSGTLDPPSQESEDEQEDRRVLAMLPLTGDNFFGRFSGLREIQRKSIPAIMEGGDVMVLSSTASGKTEAVFAPLTEMMISEGWKGLSVVYISPTRALISDIRQRLEDILLPLGVRVAQRDGDVKDLNESDPQNVIVTTPESLDSMMCWKRRQLKNVKAVVLDEVHMIDSTYRGDQTRALLRRMRMELGLRFRVYALTATLGRPDKVAAKYMDSPKLVQAGGGRGLEYHIVPELENALFWARQKKASKVLVFCNTPREAEEVINNTLRFHYPPEVLRVHHGKLEKERRKEAEALLKEGERAVCACTSTLEVGVDIGDIDLVILHSLPRSVSSLAQRIGRSNRRGDRISVVAVGKGGTMLYYERVFKSILSGKFEAPEMEFDPSVAVQQVLSSLVGGPRSEGFFEDLFDGLCAKDDVASILASLRSGGYVREEGGRLFADRGCLDLGPKVYSNIAGFESILVVEEGSGTPIGQVDLPVDNIFVLSGQAWIVKERLEDMVVVERADRSTTIAKFASYERKGAFHPLLPADIRERQEKRAKESKRE
ncbi:DEAD/DEAH box helicase [Methanomassiliicoccus luminyensis]|uniref:DEAD/DEAH box helicase n=1 Tax=Methanomassiliicoccus luminyensis TaxID=1080712 RepID=UPI0003817955|nr:DEAD/DEAH box helicase [Methanomassiliicoccus luminyensis]